MYRENVNFVNSVDCDIYHIATILKLTNDINSYDNYIAVTKVVFSKKATLKVKVFQLKGIDSILLFTHEMVVYDGLDNKAELSLVIKKMKDCIHKIWAQIEFVSIPNKKNKEDVSCT